MNSRIEFVGAIELQSWINLLEVKFNSVLQAFTRLRNTAMYYLIYLYGLIKINYWNKTLEIVFYLQATNF